MLPSPRTIVNAYRSTSASGADGPGQTTSRRKRRWKLAWNPFGMCSWLPEDDVIERFKTRVIERAKTIVGMDLARSEKFTTSLKDGLDVRETLRHFYDNDIYVKINPPVKALPSPSLWTRALLAQAQQ